MSENNDSGSDRDEIRSSATGGHNSDNDEDPTGARHVKGALRARGSKKEARSRTQTMRTRTRVTRTLHQLRARGSKKRRVVDFEVEDSEWEDVPDRTLPGLGTTTHRSRNPQLPTNACRKQRRPAPSGPNARALAARRRETGVKCLEALAEDLNVWEEERVQELAKKHGMKVHEVRRRMLGLSTYGARRKPSLYNAKVSRIMARLNAGRVLCRTWGGCWRNRQKKARGTRANNLSAAADARRMMDRLMLEITNLAEHVGMIGFAMFSRGHSHDKTVPVTIQSWGTLDFFQEVLKRDPADISHLLELWAVSRERGKPKKNKLLEMQQECTGMINTGLRKLVLCGSKTSADDVSGTVLGVTKCVMNYESYIQKLVLGKGVGLVNWPAGVDFKRMSLQSVVGPLQILLDSLKCGTMRWKVLTAPEKKKLMDQYEEMVERGEVKVKEKSRKTTSRKAKKAPIVEDDEEEGEEDEDEQEDPRARKASKPAPRPSRGEPAHRNPTAKPKPTRKPSTRDDDEGSDKERPAHPKRAAKPSHKQSTRDDDEANEGRTAKRKPARKPSTHEDDEDDEVRPTPAKPSKPARRPSPRHNDTGSDSEPPSRVNPVKPKPVRKQSASKPKTAHERLWALVQKGREVNDKARRKARLEGDGGTKRKRAEREDGDDNGGGERKAKKVRRAEGEDEPPSGRPKPKPLYRGKETTGAAGPSASDEGATAPSPPTTATSGKSTGSGRPNTVRGGKNGPPGVRVG
ncbi:hypothetical protein B0H14DRAFT_2618410 [Mycena olivaceomarginata]|nr:hypothetical protein B0H14DRAFT_2618410 [Mycena olivaceomarginata]